MDAKVRFHQYILQQSRLDGQANRPFVHGHELSGTSLLTRSLSQPHRPMRSSFKVHDENLPPVALANKSVHQRNKSSPALSTLASQQAAAAGFTKPVARRTVFADLSNTTRANQTVKDDSVIATTKSALSSLKETFPTDSSKPTAPLARPPQRPLSVSSIRGIWNNLAGVNTYSKQTNAGVRADLDPVAKPRLKKSNAVLRDASGGPTGQLHEYNHHARPTLLDSVQEVEIPRVVQSTEEKFLQRQSEKGEAVPVKTQSSVYIHQLPPIPIVSEYVEVLPENASLPEPCTTFPPSLSQQQSYNASVKYVEATSRSSLQSEPQVGFQKQTLEQISELDQTVIPALPPSEFAESWEEECYEERYEEEGYSTARSLKSKGENTGQTTIVIAPRMTAEVERELAAAALFMQDTLANDDIEEEEMWDTSMVAEYSEDIFSYMRTLEERMTPNPYYMDNQTEVQWSMRSVLMDWLIQVHNRFQLLPETLFLCVNYIDRFLSCKVVSINKLQLVGATAILVASKYEEIQCPTVGEIQYMVEGSYTVDEILKAERFMLSMLQFELGWPGPMSFLRKISKADSYDLETRTLAKYFLEVTIMDERFVACVPSLTAAGAHCLARLMLNKGGWSHAHVHHSGYTYSQLRPLISAMLSCCDDPTKHHAAVFEKYGDKRFKRASFFVQTELDKGFVLPSIAKGSTLTTAEAKAYQSSYV